MLRWLFAYTPVSNVCTFASTLDCIHTMQMLHHWGGKPERAAHCWLHSLTWHTDHICSFNDEVCQWDETALCAGSIGSCHQRYVGDHIHRQCNHFAAKAATQAWAKLHTQILSWIFAVQNIIHAWLAMMLTFGICPLTNMLYLSLLP